MASIKTLEDYNGNKIIPNTISDSVYIDEIGSGKETLKTRLNDIRAKLDTVNSSKVDRVELDSSTNELVFSAGINEIARITIATQSKNFTGLTLNSEDGKIYLADENGNAFGTGIKITGGGSVEADKHITGINLNFSSESLKVGKNINLIATLEPSDATIKNVTWTADNDNVTIVPDGLQCLVAGAKVGSSIVTCASNHDPNIKANCNFTISESVSGGLDGISLRVVDGWVGQVVEDTSETNYVRITSPYQKAIGHVQIYNNVTIYEGIASRDNVRDDNYKENFISLDIYNNSGSKQATINAVEGFRDVFNATNGEWITWFGGNQTIKMAKNRFESLESTPTLEEVRTYFKNNAIILNINMLVEAYKSTFKSYRFDGSETDITYLYSANGTSIWKIKTDISLVSGDNYIGCDSLYCDGSGIIPGIAGYDVPSGYSKVGIPESHTPTKSAEEVKQFLTDNPFNIYYIEE